MMRGEYVTRPLYDDVGIVRRDAGGADVGGGPLWASTRVPTHGEGIVICLPL